MFQPEVLLALTFLKRAFQDTDLCGQRGGYALFERAEVAGLFRDRFADPREPLFRRGDIEQPLDERLEPPRRLSRRWPRRSRTHPACVDHSLNMRSSEHLRNWYAPYLSWLDMDFHRS